MTRSALGQLWSILMAVSGLGLLAVFVARGVAAGKAVRAGATTLVAIALAAPCASAQQRSLAANELGRQRVFNCGLNACAVTLHAMEQAVDLEVLAGSLGCGNHWENAASLQAMQHLLESRGLQVTALKDLKIDQVPDLLDGQHVVILHCQHSTHGGHYLVIGGRQSDKVFVVDPGTYADWLALEQFTTHIGQAASGFALVVGKRSVNAPVVHTLDEELIEVDLGDVTAVDGMVSADIAVTNPKEAAIEIMSVQSSCSCFQHAEFLVGKQRLEAGAHDTLRLTFKKSKLALGVNRQEVLLGCLLPNRHDIMLRVKAEVRAGQPTRRALAMPAQIDLGIMMSGSAKPDKQPLSLLLPMGVSVKQVSVDSTYVHCRSIAATVDEGTPYRQPSRTEDYEVEIQMPDSGDLRAEIVFQLTDDQLKSISVPVRVQRDRQEKQR